MITNGGTVRAIFDYTRDTGMEPEIYFYEPPNGDEPRRPGDDPREMTVHNGWDRASVFSPDREGPWPGRNRRSCCRRRVPLVEQGRCGRVRFASGRAHAHGAALGDAREIAAKSSAARGRVRSRRSSSTRARLTAKSSAARGRVTFSLRFDNVGPSSPSG